MGVSAIVVSYRTGPALAACLDRLEAAPALDEIVVVDNGNPPEVLAALSTRGGKCVLKTGHGNVGFSRACNLGAAAARSDQLAFLNPDLLIEPGCIESMQAALDGACAPSIVGARILWPDGREQRGARRDTITPWTAAVSALGLGRFEVLSPLLRDPHRESDPVPEAPLRVGAVSGAAMLMRRADFVALGGFDEGYFLHAEDLDLCRRANEAGGDVLFAPAARATHIKSTSQESALKVEGAKARSMTRYLFKFARTPAGLLGAALVAPPLWGVLIARGMLRDACGNARTPAPAH
jgi:GT2 family glycosyltransferase